MADERTPAELISQIKKLLEPNPDFTNTVNDLLQGVQSLSDAFDAEISKYPDVFDMSLSLQDRTAAAKKYCSQMEQLAPKLKPPSIQP